MARDHGLRETHAAGQQFLRERGATLGKARKLRAFGGDTYIKRIANISDFDLFRKWRAACRNRLRACLRLICSSSPALFLSRQRLVFRRTVQVRCGRFARPTHDLRKKMCRQAAMPFSTAAHFILPTTLRPFARYSCLFRIDSRSAPHQHERAKSHAHARLAFPFPLRSIRARLGV